MATSTLHLLSQGCVLGALARTAIAGLTRKPTKTIPHAVPGPWIGAILDTE